MDLKGAEIRNIKGFCSEIGSKKDIPIKINIPYYQRPYKWEEDNIKKLISDFFKNEKKEYFVGSAVMISVPNLRHDVIDGQQRITTMFLLGYVKFLLQRSYVEEIISKHKSTKLDNSLAQLEDVCKILFGDEFEGRVRNIHKIIIDKIDADDGDDNLYDELLSLYQTTLFLPEKNLTDEIQYLKKYYSLQKKLLGISDLALHYNRESYNEKLKEALSSTTVILSDSRNPYITSTNNYEDVLINQYKNAMRYEFDELSRLENPSNSKPLEYSVSLIETINYMLDNIKFCVIITGNERDAYTLFEVLNDRALEIEDLDLIKNLFYKWYCNHTVNEDDNEIDKCIEVVDRIWVEQIFPSNTGKECSKLISFLAAEFFTADDSLKYNDNARYRELLESKYLVNKNVYKAVDIKNDIYIYQMLSIILKNFKFAFQNKNEKVLSAEMDYQKSITYRTLHLLNALKQYGVIPAITNTIIKKFIDKNTDDSGLIQIEKFEGFIDGLKNDYLNNDLAYKAIHNISFQFWKFALLSLNAELPRGEAKKVIFKNNINSLNMDYYPSQDVLDKMFSEFKKWINEWKYGKSETDLKAKVLFLNLFNTEKQDNKLCILSTGRNFRTTKIQLDHMEANNLSENAKEKYFRPSNPSELRETYIDSIGNFMIMDSDNNNNKNNCPLQDALKYYEEMCPNHWMIEEVREMLLDNEYSTVINIATQNYTVPKEEFFTKRREILMNYFETILKRKLDDKEMFL